jgi:hypothetical protein
MYFELSTGVPAVDNLNLFPEGGGFGVNPVAYMGEEGNGVTNSWGALLRDGYFRNGPDSFLPNTTARNAVENGLGYYNFHLGGNAADSYTLSASELYKNVASMSAINLWVGSDYTFRRGTIGDGGDNEGIGISDDWTDLYDGFPFEFRPLYVGETVGVFDNSFAVNGYVAPTLSFENFDAIPGVITANWATLIEDPVFLSDWLHGGATDAAAMTEFIGKVQALWVIRVGNTVDHFVTYRAIRGEAMGDGSGRLGVFVRGGMIVPEIEFQLFDTSARLTSMMIQSASSNSAITILGPILCFADFIGDTRNLSANNRPGDPWRAQWRVDGMDATRIGNHAERGPVSNDWRLGSSDDNVNNAAANVPTQDNLVAHYDEFSGAHRAVSDGWWDNLRRSNRCEFGIPTGNKSSHVMNLQTIEGRMERSGVLLPYVTLAANSQGNETYIASFRLFGFDPAQEAPNAAGFNGGKFAYVSGREGIGLGATMPATYIRFLRCEIQMEVWPSGLMGRWYFDAPWQAELAGLITATVDMATNQVFSYDARFIVGENGMITLLNGLRLLA